jgi:hypothetical protein
MRCLQGSKVMLEEPDALIGHVRVCGGLAGNRGVYPDRFGVVTITLSP